MKVRIWGARGSHPVPITPKILRRKMVSLVQRIQPEDLESDKTRLDFLTKLPEWLYGTVGGNTPCLELIGSAKEGEISQQIVFDAGTGIIELGNKCMQATPRRKEYHIFFTHFHYDHLQGFPFFVPAYDQTVSIHFYSPVARFKQIVHEQMRHPYFPITMDGKMTSNMTFTELTGDSIQIDNLVIRWRKLNHPGGSYGYRVSEGNKTFAYISDVELMPTDFEQNQANKSFFQGLDTLVLDTPYTLGEAIEKYNWGHSSFTHGVEFAHVWKIKTLFLFHHEPRYNDQRLYLNLQSARWYAKSLGNTALTIYLALEGAEQTV